MTLEEAKKVFEVYTKKDKIPKKVKDQIMWGGIYLANYTGDNDTVEIPAEIDGEPVKCIGGFEENENIRKVIIDESAHLEIVDGAFKNCKNLEEIIMPKDGIRATAKAFAGCKKLWSGNFLIINDKLIGYNGKVKDGVLTIPEGVISIEPYAIKKKSDIRKVIIPKSIDRLETYSFEECENLESVEFLGNPILSGSAFRNCASLSEIIGSFSVGRFGKPFSMCDKLIDQNGFIIVNGFLVQHTGTQPIAIIPSTTSRIAAAAFCNSRSETVQIPPSVVEIQEYAFSNNNCIKTVVGGEGIKIIRKGAFESCSNLTEMNISSAATIEEGAFSGCKNLIGKNGMLVVNGELAAFDYKKYCNYYSTEKIIMLPKEVARISNFVFNGLSYLTVEEFVMTNNIEKLYPTSFNFASIKKFKIIDAETKDLICEESFSLSKTKTSTVDQSALFKDFCERIQNLKQGTSSTSIENNISSVELSFEEAAEHVFQVYDIEPLVDDFGKTEGFNCPECLKAIYKDDWDGINGWTKCPICGYEW